MPNAERWNARVGGVFPDAAAYYGERADKCAGAFYGGDGSSLAANSVFIIAIIAWVGGTCAILFTAIRFTVGIRVSVEVEVSHPWRCRRNANTVPIDDFVLFTSCRWLG